MFFILPLRREAGMGISYTLYMFAAVILLGTYMKLMK
jgi:hypothetical protein